MVDDDMKLEALQSTHYLKSLITAEMPMDLERKGEQSYQGKMYVRFLAFSNGDLESRYDHSDGFYRRQLILSVKKKPPNREDDPFLADKLCGEIEGIFLWCLEGLRRLQSNNFRFTESSQTKANREDARREADNVLLFLRSEGYIRLKADACTSSKELYEVYKMWCEENSLNAIKARGFSDALIANQRRYNLDSTGSGGGAAGRRGRGGGGGAGRGRAGGGAGGGSNRVLLDNNIYSNAHNEWLTLLVQQGILGVIAYGGIFLTAFRNLRISATRDPRALAVFLGLTGYLICSLFTFQHVLSTPFDFAFFGMAEGVLCKVILIKF